MAKHAADRDGVDRAEAVDAFGITRLYPTLTGGLHWTSHWVLPRRFSGVDPQDPWFDADHGSATYRAGGGRLWISGAAPRMYIHDPALERQWSDVEATVYALRRDDSDVDYSGITVVARTNHLRTEEGSRGLCDTRGYGARLRFDGHADFEKETAHPDNQAIGNVELFPAGLPTNTWIGMKFVVYDAEEGVHLELWLDLTGGRGGGDWQMVNSIIDDGTLFGAVPCDAGIDPRAALTGDPRRAGSESDRPNLSVYFRSDGIGPEGMVYRWASVREIVP